MNKYDFKLTPAYCLFNGVAVKEQNGTFIKFLLENPEDEILKQRLRRAFTDHIENLRKVKSRSKAFDGELVTEFNKGSRNQVRNYVSALYLNEEKKSESARVHEDSQKNEAAAVLLLDRILSEGRKHKATDIHIENKVVKFRVNGALEYFMKLSKKSYGEVIQRIKLLGGMNVLEKQKSQDGHFVYGNKNPMFIRVSSVNVIDELYGGEEAVVLRLLDTSRIPLSIDFLGFNENQLQRIGELEKCKNGLVLVCGPTGSGKSTTVASILLELEKENNGKLKIISLEDPPEYFIPGVSQIKMGQNENGYKESLNHVFRLDPDVIMIGEIRDEVSAATALRAALTGHLVFATLHTGGVSESILRLENLKVERKMLCSVLRGVICQELNYLDGEIKLYGDIGIPVAGFCGKVKPDMGEDELDQLFIHETNYSELLSKTLEVFNRKNLMLDMNDKKVQRVWKENKKNGKVHKRIV